MGKQVITVELHDIQVPIHIIKEWRTSIRSSITSGKVILRLPHYFGPKATNAHLERTKHWISRQFHKKPGLKSRFIKKVYENGDVIHLPDKKYTLYIKEDDRTRIYSKFKNREIHVYLNEQLDLDEKAKLIQKSIAKWLAEDNLERVRSRIKELNRAYLNESILDIRLKNNSSNWGSCSSSRRINISIKTLLAPLDVQDYIFIHELAHLKEMNHSKSFWELVRKMDPEYKGKVNWIKRHGHTCRF